MLGVTCSLITAQMNADLCGTILNWALGGEDTRWFDAHVGTANRILLILRLSQKQPHIIFIAQPVDLVAVDRVGGGSGKGVGWIRSLPQFGPRHGWLLFRPMVDHRQDWLPGRL